MTSTRPEMEPKTHEIHKNLGESAAEMEQHIRTKMLIHYATSIGCQCFRYIRSKKVPTPPPNGENPSTRKKSIIHTRGLHPTTTLKKISNSKTGVGVVESTTRPCGKTIKTNCR
jgi:hypothetical protein